MSPAPTMTGRYGSPGAAALPRPWALALGGSLSMAAANGIDRFIYTPILPVMAHSLQWTASQAGMVASANYLGYLLGALFAARPGLRGARRHWLLASLAASALCTGGMALTSSLPPMLALRLSSGFAGAVAIVMAIALVVERLAHAGRSDLVPLHFAGVGIGIVVSALIVAGLQASTGARCGCVRAPRRWRAWGWSPRRSTPTTTRPAGQPPLRRDLWVPAFAACSPPTR
jgi:MFS family permease